MTDSPENDKCEHCGTHHTSSVRETLQASLLEAVGGSPPDTEQFYHIGMAINTVRENDKTSGNSLEMWLEPHNLDVETLSYHAIASGDGWVDDFMRILEERDFNSLRQACAQLWMQGFLVGNASAEGMPPKP